MIGEYLRVFTYHTLIDALTAYVGARDQVGIYLLLGHYKSYCDCERSGHTCSPTSKRDQERTARIKSWHCDGFRMVALMIRNPSMSCRSCFDFFTTPFISANATRHEASLLHTFGHYYFTHQCAATLATAIVDEAKARVLSISTACSLPIPRNLSSPTVPSTRSLPIP